MFSDLTKFLAVTAAAASLSFAGETGAEAAPVCASLKGLKIAPTSIQLPTRGAELIDAEAVAPKEGNAGSCIVTGAIAPIDPHAGVIRFKVALPETWNGRALMLGGTGYNGFIPDVAAGPVQYPPDVATPLMRGYVVFGSDSGHQAKSFFDPGLEFVAVDETYRNYIGDALKKTRDAALAVVRARYGRTPSRSYFVGGSKGGGEALQVAARWPQDWDGVVAFYPGRDLTVTLLGMVNTMRVLSTPGAFPSPAKQILFHRAALQACDRLDGASDGIISNVRRCEERFVPRTATVDGRSLLCAESGGAQDGCLTASEIDALVQLATPASFVLTPEGEKVQFPGFDALTADFRASRLSLFKQSVIGDVPPIYPIAMTASPVGLLASGFVKYAIIGDPSANPWLFDPATVTRETARVQSLHRIDQVDGDLTPFWRRGGRLIVLHGLDDMFISPRATEKYVTELTSRMGPARTKSFLRYFEVPGFGHSDGATFRVSWDSLSTIQDWVEKDIDPAGTTVLTDLTGDPGRTRPACAYPTWPKFKGGELRTASSFVCSRD